MWYYHYPVIGAESRLPVCVEGIGLNDVQYHVIRESGYYLPQILYCTEGEGVLITEGKTYTIHPYQGFFLPADTPHEYYTTGDVWDTHWIILGGKGIHDILRLFGFTRSGVYTLSDITRLNHLFKKIYSVMKSDKLYGNYYAGGFAYEFLVEFYRLANNKASEEQTGENHTILSAVNYITSHYAEDITLEQLCSVAGVTKQHLCKLFKKTFNMRPVEYITKHRIAQAKRRLRTTNDTVKEISLDLGFKDSTYFCRVFRRYELMTPVEYRKSEHK